MVKGSLLPDKRMLTQSEYPVSDPQGTAGVPVYLFSLRGFLKAIDLMDGAGRPTGHEPRMENLPEFFYVPTRFPGTRLTLQI